MDNNFLLGSAKYKFAVRLALAAVCNLCLLSSSRAQTPVAADPAGFSLPPLPDLSQSQAALVVTGTQAQQFRSIIPEPLYPTIRSGQLSIQVAAHSPWETGLSGAQWNEAPQIDCLSGKGLAAEVTWSNGGFPCGTRLTLERLSAGTPGTGSLSVDAGRRYLLNAERAIASAALTRSEYRVQSSAGSLTDGSLRIERLFPHLVVGSSVPPKGAVIWRERVTWIEPKPVGGLTLLTLRFRGADEDMVFQRSPISNNFRQLTGSNRGDDLVGLPLAADDLFVWSSKIEWMESAKLLGVRKMLVPVVGTKRIAVKPSEKGCVEAYIPSSTDDTVGGVWSNNLFFIPREVAEVEVVSGDPFSLSGQMRVFIDTETMLPVMKIVSDRTGQQERFVVGSIMGLGGDDNQPRRNMSGPLLALGTHGRMSVVMPEFVMLCDGYSESLNEQLFDLRSVIQNKDADKSGKAPSSGGAKSSDSQSSAEPVEEDVVDER